MHKYPILQIVTTFEKKADAQSLANLLVNERKAACVQIVGPIESIYRWKEKVETAEEWRCEIKTRPELGDEVVEAIRANHPYDEPEIISVPIVDTSPSYLAWLLAQTE